MSRTMKPLQSHREQRLGCGVLFEGPCSTCLCESGVALVIVAMAMLLLSAVGAALVVVTSADVLIAANVGASNEALYAADAVFERTLAELREVPDLTAVLNGTASSGFRDGAPTGQRSLADGTRIDLAQVLSLATCRKLTGCSVADLNASSPDRPWGALNPRWRLYSYGPLDPAQGGIRSGLPAYVVSMVADDQVETDGDSSRDGARTGTLPNPGAGVLLLRAEGFGRRGAHRVIEGAIVRRDVAALARWEAADPATRGNPPSSIAFLQVLAWRNVR